MLRQYNNDEDSDRLIRRLTEFYNIKQAAENGGAAYGQSSASRRKGNNSKSPVRTTSASVGSQ